MNYLPRVAFWNASGLWMKPPEADKRHTSKAMRRRRQKRRFLLRHARGADVLVVTEANVVPTDKTGLDHWLSLTAWTATLPDGTNTWTRAAESGFRGVLVLLRKTFVAQWDLSFSTILPQYVVHLSIAAKGGKTVAVSYTHLTLPTICSV